MNDEDNVDKHDTSLFNCVICNQDTESTASRPIGLIGLLQATSGE